MTRLPDASLHNPDPLYLRELLATAGYEQRRAAHQIGISDRLLRYYLVSVDHPTYRAAPYPVQFAIECLADAAKDPA